MLQRRLARGAEDEPVLRVVVLTGLNEVVLALDALAVEAERDLVVLPFERLVPTPVEDADLAGAVLTFGDAALERRVVHRVVFHVHGQPPHVRLFGQTLRHRERHEHTAALKPQVVVQPARVVLVDHVERLLGRLRECAFGLRRYVELALALVFLERLRRRIDRRRDGLQAGSVDAERFHRPVEVLSLRCPRGLHRLEQVAHALQPLPDVLDREVGRFYILIELGPLDGDA